MNDNTTCKCKRRTELNLATIIGATTLDNVCGLFQGKHVQLESVFKFGIKQHDRQVNNTYLESVENIQRLLELIPVSGCHLSELVHGNEGY